MIFEDKIKKFSISLLCEIMKLLNKDDCQSLVDILKKKYFLTRPDIIPIIGTLLHPITKNVVSIYVDENELEKINLIMLKIPVVSEVIEFITNSRLVGNDGNLSSSALKIIADHIFSDHFYILWCHDCKKLFTNHNLSSALKSESKIHKTKEELVNALCKSGLDFKTLYNVKVLINILQNGNIFTRDNNNRELYYFDNITFDAFESVVKHHYNEGRHKDLEFSLRSGLNWGAYCKSTKKIVGWITLTYTGSIAALYVLDEHRRKGLGVDLVSYLVRKCSLFGIIPHGFSINSESYLEKAGFTLYTDCLFVV